MARQLSTDRPIDARSLPTAPSADRQLSHSPSTTGYHTCEAMLMNTKKVGGGMHRLGAMGARRQPTADCRPPPIPAALHLRSGCRRSRACRRPRSRRCWVRGEREAGGGGACFCSASGRSPSSTHVDAHLAPPPTNLPLRRRLAQAVPPVQLPVRQAVRGAAPGGCSPLGRLPFIAAQPPLNHRIPELPRLPSSLTLASISPPSSRSAPAARRWTSCWAGAWRPRR